MKRLVMGFAGCASVILLGCGPDQALGAACPGTTRQAVYFGSPAADWLATGDHTAGSIGALLEPGTGSAICTVTHVAPGWVLTARHCLTDARFSHTVQLRFGGPEAAIQEVSTFYTHPDADLALLRVETLPPDLAFTPWNAEPVTFDWVGRRATLAGWGLTDTGQRDALAFATESIVEIDEDRIVTDGLGQGGACAGDSGGPLLGRTADGAVRILGVLSTGAQSCLGRDDFLRLDAVADWLAETVGMPPPPPSLDCENVPAEGRCFDGLAVWCEAGTLTSERCDAGLQCGWSGTGYRCVGPADDPCEGADGFGRCEGSASVRCEHGVVLTESCGDCAPTCGILPRTGRTSCMSIAADAGPDPPL